MTVELLDFERPWKLVLGKRVPGLQLTSLLIETNGLPNVRAFA